MRGWIKDLGLGTFPPFYKDPLFLLALLAGGLFWLLLWMRQPTNPLRPEELLSFSFFFLVLWQPAVEELLFRGFLQGAWLNSRWGGRSLFGISAANLGASIAFTFAHLFSHPPLWAAAVFFPSLLFGFFRDRHASLYPSLALHIFYNGGYFLLTGLPR
ncbi:MAG: JDVT-CTERM system CAAX-type protease [Nitrospirae bacterium]|nr:JDVT-CTERM system CAAX-type protease [Candidatus Manganitrophaceae bacterium]